MLSRAGVRHPPMNSKSVFASKTFWAALVAALPQVLDLLNVPTETAGKVVTLGGIFFAIVFRVTAKTAVHVLPRRDPAAPTTQ